jgi:hypothetical protein
MAGRTSSSWGYFQLARFLGAGIALGVYGLFSLAGVPSSSELCLGSIVLGVILTIIILAIIHQYTSQPPARTYPQQPYQPSQYHGGPYYPPGQSMYYQQSQPYNYQQPQSYGAQPYGPYGTQITKCRYCDSQLSGVSSICPRCGRSN